MALADGTYTIRSTSHIEVLAHAPGHKFKAQGPGIEGQAIIKDGRIESAEARFPLSALDSGDMLGNRELKKFFGLGKGPKHVTGRLLEPAAIQENGAQLSAQMQLGLRVDGPEAKTTLKLQGSLQSIAGSFSLRFSDLGYKPPKLLFFKVKEQLDLTLTLHASAPDASLG